MTRLKILGSEPAWPSANRACSGYILDIEQQTILIDAGTGVFERLRATADPESITAIIISHLHFDHWADLIPYRYYLSLEAKPSNPPKLYLPPNGVEILRRVVEPIDPNPDFFTGTFETFEYDPQSGLHIGKAHFQFRKMLHPIDTYGMRISTNDRTFVYSADTGWEDSIYEFTKQADLLLCEAAYVDQPGNPNVHITAEQAGKIAQAGNVKKLVLTHLPERKAEVAIGLAKREFNGEVDYAYSSREFEV